ncbi:N-acetyl-alpha-D-glucosaminyl L-malate synthase BshA [Polaribacter sp. Hel1_33_78]|mgnify:CR=1 FL=1|jgi:N-acetyl-alpha-D-glucosaminyl L-malate synthase BshA|uniref:N-acetyl-alpha-D-glucosaminyl L-malate synthase BshA n=1 Tax=unclassified Polaribacter TaxID=196858 RepID=UPI00052D9A52|nr:MULTISPECIES: N-acetyl-alpha-D-glucosaminyl L-malate synthase BshA [unclassified Polaribacter]MBT3741650.1 N-acetyl-alpha-D-glucosaminyl L-malate synthase BshA [Polaribacter sp.]KGL60912.1 glycosyltransferase, GT4 family [Polaribacter sp. Hel1_33_49]MBT4412674.1 N-acetyl-alpha-D-glucosaminyl L-malate synthase BshA [Polaribacter sp.]MDG1195771.1 N-acetyl-alpha-D-glucosaminyl L-malate synthase BshA [Polaribacter sp.]MDG2436090.1 N-acetyl-alpha-D-glucosaminyl L-malate synthase BshA [Polaribact
MKIGIVCYPTFGGSGVVATELGMALADNGHEVHFITYNQPVRLDFLSHKLHFHQVLIEEYPLFQYQPYELALSSKMVEVVEKHELEVLHVHYAIPHAYAAFMAKQMLLEKGISIKVVTTLHGTDITLVGSHPTYKTAVEFSINNSDVVTAVSNSLKQTTNHLFKIKKEIQVVYNFIDIEKYDKAENQECKRDALAKPNERILTHISNFRPVKRVEDVIKIFYEVQKEIPSKLLMIGEGPDRAKAEILTKKLGITDNVFYLGNSTETVKILCYTDLFLLPSQTESFGLAALEAMAAKTAVISTNTGGLPEVNIQGKTGFLSDLGDIKDMAKNAISILKEDAILDQFKRNAKEHTKKFSLQNILPVYEEIYNSCYKTKV